MFDSLTFFDLLLLVSATGTLSLLVLKYIRTARLRASLPPGPRGVPLIGNIFDMPSSREWERFTEWGRKYDHAENVGRQELHLFGPPEFPMLGEMMGWDRGLVLSHYGERFRTFRRLLHRFMGTRTVVAQHHDTPENLIEHLRRYAKTYQRVGALDMTWRSRTAGAVVLDLCGDELVHIAEVASLEFSRAATPGAFLVDSLPFLRHFPEWFPGAGWKKLGREWRADTHKVVDTPFEYVQKRRTAGIAGTSFVDVNTKDNMSEHDADILKWAAVSIYFGGSDTMVSATSSFFLAMTLYPGVMKKAQAELDAVVGSHRLPTFEDRDRLPYLNAVIKEVLRWAPVTPFGGHHRLMEDDIQDGHLIPAGSAVIVNIWGLLHDEKIYSRPMIFDPERFIATEKMSSEIDPHSILFGYGRRSCPGMHLADASLFLYIATILAAFDISKAVDDCGRVIETNAEFTSGLVSHPSPFQCSIKPRSLDAISLIREANMVEP
ncbi:cytochrome P450 [Multifurca ochricompacta]|uniref:Cytochrome P450 n=1 Tax=Multifurca ochricompacta TaxID=376703 RepID=A0AAD4QMY3_9AGAM|nr:cytochrome P450 [Multifurca ochricompacta]